MDQWDKSRWVAHSSLLCREKKDQTSSRSFNDRGIAIGRPTCSTAFVYSQRRSPTMRAYRLDAYLVVCFVFSLWFFSNIGLMAQCDNKCRMRETFWDDANQSCSTYLWPECNHCTCAACWCLPQVGDPVNRSCQQIQNVNNQVQLISSCKPNCQVPKGWVVEARPQSLTT